jgi:16S rRNA (cytosine967-C5)-methyltransferase
MNPLHRSAREISLITLVRIETTGSYADRILASLFRGSTLGPDDRHLATELVMGTTRWRKRLDWTIQQYLHSPLEKLTPWIRNALRMGLYQLLFDDRIPEYAAVSESVDLARTYGHTGTARMVNAVLRTIQRQPDRISLPSRDEDPLGYATIALSHPEWLVSRWMDRWGENETIALCKANNQVPPLSIRANRLRTDRESLSATLQSEGCTSRPCELSQDGLILTLSDQRLTDLTAYHRGLFTVQDESAMLIAPLLSPPPGATVVDLCSAPGGKTTHLGELMADHGLVVAVDRQNDRLHILLDNCRRLELNCIVPVLADGRYVHLTQVDAVLVDAPCSGTGVLRRRVDLRWRLSPEQIRQLQQVQLELLHNAARLLGPGGILIYSTCTLEPEENEEVVDIFTSREPAFRSETAAPFAPSATITDQGFLRTWPHRQGIDGVFAARLRKE